MPRALPMTIRAQHIVQHVVLAVIVVAMLLVPDSLVSFGSRAVMAGVALLAAVAISSRRLRDGALLVSPLDYGWQPYVLLTGVTVLFAPSPRRSLESWLWLAAIQLPTFYAALYLFRRQWHERALYRALLVAGGYFYWFALSLTLNYAAQWFAARADGVAAPGFRLFGIMNHPNIFAMFIAISTPCLIGYLFVGMTRLERAAVLLWLAGAALSLFGTGSRTGLIATVIGLSVAFILGLLAHPAQPLARFRVWASNHRRQATVAIAAASVVAIATLGFALYLQFGRPMQDDGGGRRSYYRSALTMFVEHPVVGAGPTGFLRSEIRTHSVPPWHPLQHAHNMFLNTAAESGLIGLVGFLALLAAAAWTCVAVWRRRPSRRPLIAGPIGGLIAFCISGLLDTPINQFGPFFLAALLLAYVASALPTLSDTRLARARSIAAVAWVVVLLLVLALIPYSIQWDVTRPDRPLDDSASLTTEARQLDAAAALDASDPLVALQSAYKWAAVAAATDDPQALDTAITRFERGVQLDPDLGLHALNLATLYSRAGRTDDAVRAARRATELAAGDGVAWLNFGLVLEHTGEDDEAQDAYAQALRHEPRWVAAGFWQVSPVRQRAHDQYLAMPDRSRYYDLLTSGDTARRNSRRDDAINAYQQALTVAPGAVAATYVHGLIALADGNPAAARVQMVKVTTMDIVEVGDQIAFVDAWLCLGNLAGPGGDADGMLRDYSTAYRFLTARGLGDFGTKGSPAYAILGYQRFGLIGDYLPGVVMLDITPEQAVRFKALAEAKAAQGDTKQAADIYQHVLESNPNDAEARQALLQLMP
jgi:tetratricopeptide (TPR) repeat protein